MSPFTWGITIAVVSVIIIVVTIVLILHFRTSQSATPPTNVQLSNLMVLPQETNPAPYSPETEGSPLSLGGSIPQQNSGWAPATSFVISGSGPYLCSVTIQGIYAFAAPNGSVFVPEQDSSANQVSLPFTKTFQNVAPGQSIPIVTQSELAAETPVQGLNAEGIAVSTISVKTVITDTTKATRVNGITLQLLNNNNVVYSQAISSGDGETLYFYLNNVTYQPQLTPQGAIANSAWYCMNGIDVPVRANAQGQIQVQTASSGACSSVNVSGAESVCQPHDYATSYSVCSQAWKFFNPSLPAPV